MNTFVNNVGAPVEVTTTNGMAAYDTTGERLVDLFFSIGAARNDVEGIKKKFTLAFAENGDLAMKILFWARDVRQGAGERNTFREILKSLESYSPTSVIKNIKMVPVLGRWDDLLIFTDTDVKQAAYSVIRKVLMEGDAAKCMLDKIGSISEDECAAELAKLEQVR